MARKSYPPLDPTEKRMITTGRAVRAVKRYVDRTGQPVSVGARLMKAYRKKNRAAKRKRRTASDALSRAFSEIATELDRLFSDLVR